MQHRAGIPAREFRFVGIDDARPAPGVLEALDGADVVVLPPSNPVVSIGPILAVPGLADALRAGSAPIVGVSGIVGGRPVKGMADACLAAIGVAANSAAVAELYGPRGDGGILDGWVYEHGDPEPTGIDKVFATSTLMAEPSAAAALAKAAVGLVT